MTVQEGLTEKPQADDHGHVGINDLPPEIIAHVMDHLPRKASIANSLAGVCLAWRTAILSEETYLRNVEFKINCNQPFKGLAPIKGAIAHRRTWQRRQPDNHRQRPPTFHANGGANENEDDDDDDEDEGLVQALRERRAQAVVKAGANGAGVPRILTRAAESNNLSALETLGMLHEMRGDHSGAYRAYRKAATMSSSVGQFKLGEIFYRGTGNQGVDGEEALFWLNKAAKNPTLDPENLATAAGIIGFLHLDGEGTQPCNVTAVKWFKLAAEHGNKEADKTLGWLYNTGQY